MTSAFRKHLLKAFMLTSFLSTSYLAHAMDEDIPAVEVSIPSSSRFIQALAPYISILQENMTPNTIKRALRDIRDFLANNYLTEAENTIENWKKITQVVCLAEYLNAYDIKGSFDFQNSTLDPHFIHDYLDKLTTEDSEEVQNALSLLCSSVFITQELLGNPLATSTDLKRKLPSYPLRAKITTPGIEIPEWLKDSVLRLSLGERILGITFDEIFEATHATFKKPNYAEQQIKELSDIHAARIYSILNATETEPRIPTRVAALYPTKGDGECGWYTSDMTYNYALSSLLQAVADGRIYDSSYYNTVLKRMRDVKGDSFFESLLAKEGFTRDPDELKGLNRVIADKTARYNESLEVIGAKPEVPLELQTVPEEAEAQTVWRQAVISWETTVFDPWNTRKDQLSKSYETSVWETQLGYIGDFRLPNDEIATFIQEDFPRRYPNKFVEFGVSDGGEAADWLDILQHLENINIQVWAPLEHPVFSSRKPMLTTPDRKLGLLNLKHISGTAAHISMLLTGDLPQRGHFSRLLCTNVTDGKDTTYFAQVAKAIRHEKRYK